MRTVLFAMAIAWASAAPSLAQTVDEIIARNTAAKGGAAKLKAIKTLRVTGTVTLAPGVDAPIVLELQRATGMRMDITFQGLTLSQGYDGARAWVLNPLETGNVPKAMSADESKAAAEQVDIDGPLIDYKAKGNTVELVGREKVGDVDTFKIKVTTKQGTVRTFYIETERFLEVKEESKRIEGGAEVEQDTLFGDYKEVGGLVFAHLIDGGQKGSSERQKIVVGKIEINPPLDVSRFRMPSAK